MDRRVTPLTGRPEPPPPRARSNTKWGGVLLLVAGIAGGYLLAAGTAGDVPLNDNGSAEPVASVSTMAPSVVESGRPAEAAVEFSGTILASVEFGRGLVTWAGDADPVTTRLTARAGAAAFDAARRRLAVTFPEYGGDRLALHIGTPDDLRFVTSGVTGFAWHATDTRAIAWVEESKEGFVLMKAVVANRVITAAPVAVVPNRARPVAWGTWGYAVEGENGLTTISPSGAVVATGDVQFVAAGNDGRLIVARPAGLPLSSDWAVTGPDLAVEQALDRFGDLEEHPTAAAILPLSGRIVLVSNRFGDQAGLARIEILSADGSPVAVIRSGMIADSIGWSPDEEHLAVGGYYYGSNQVNSVVLLAAADGKGRAVEVPFDDQVRPLGIRN